MSSVRTDVAAMEASAGHVESINDQIQGRMNSLKGRVESATAFWQGGSSKAFQDLMERFAAASQKHQAALADIADKIRQSGKGYDEAEQANQAAISQAGASGSLAGL
ncbi:MAG: WXG100 family type VII secretion target [Rhodococcus sp.]|nr:WXG100 family type VII secretion target [Rhodococcus sp. (in: high G+C Gram-positive bacteria)]